MAKYRIYKAYFAMLRYFQTEFTALIHFLELLIMNDVKVCFCEHDPLMRNRINAFFRNETNFSVSVFSDDEFLDRDFPFDIAVLDLSVDKFRAVYDDLRDDETKIIFVYDNIPEHERIISSYKHSGALARPYSLNDVSAVVYSLLPSPEKYRISSSRSVDEKLSNIFIRAGIPPHIKGYQYLRTAVKLAINQPDIVNSITKKLYPTVAEYYSTTPSKVERAIRHAIDVAWSRGKIENINAIFGIKIYSRGDKPTNGELIALIADKMVIEMM